MLAILRMRELEVKQIHAYGRCFPISSRSNWDSDKNKNLRYAFAEFLEILVREIVVYEVEGNSY
jgi:hypothetical protein